jgi:transcriptional regulator with XRE-family HTH domain
MQQPGGGPVELSRRELFTRLGQQVRARRTALGISQEALAARAGVHRTYVAGIELGLRNVSLWNIYRLALALGVEPADLIPRLEGNPEPLPQ